MLADAPIEWNASAATDYVYRGVSQTGGRPQFSGGIELIGSHAYAGAWASNVDLSADGDPNTKAETDLYAGWKRSVGKIEVDLGAIYYAYLGAPASHEHDFGEAYLRVSRTTSRLTLGTSVYVAPGQGDSLRSMRWIEATAGFALSPTWRASGAVGRQDRTSGGGYDTWTVGLSYTPRRALSVDLRLSDTSRHELGTAYRPRLVAQISRTY
jgi:uncharacterized protein (TIGR02001 family)